MPKRSQGFGQNTRSRPGYDDSIPEEAPPRYNKRGRLVQHLKPGQVWRVLASRNGEPATEHFVLIGEIPEHSGNPRWEKKIKSNVDRCKAFPLLMRSHLKYGTPGHLSMEEISENFLYLRTAELKIKDWTVAFEFDWVCGYVEYIEPVGFEPWIPAYEREKMALLPEPMQKGNMRR